MIQKTIKLETFWISDCCSTESSIYKTKGFKVFFRKDNYSSFYETYLYYDKKNALIPIQEYSDNIKICKTQKDAIQFSKTKKQDLLDWYQQQIDEYNDRIKETLKL